ncbi:hypothetical protein [Roseibium sp.]|uniref:hypothetical protein n=1 Tax=Roseibium sp. TaxID=1936156 RepID=UPI003A96D204
MTDIESDIFWNNVRAVGLRLNRVMNHQKSINWFVMGQSRFGNKAPMDLLSEGRTEDVLKLIEELEGD